MGTEGPPGGAQSVGHLTSAQVMISRFVSSSPASGSVLTARGLELLRILCLALSLCPSPAHTLSVCLSLKNNFNKKWVQKK